MDKNNLRNLLESYKDKTISKEEVMKQLGKNNMSANITNSPAHKDKKNMLDKREDIAVIGMSCRFPFAENLEEYWNVIKNGINAITKVPKVRFDIDDMEDNACRWGGFIKDVDKFDSLFFNISPKEAEMMDPQQRLFLMEAWNAIEDAGYSVQEMDGKKCCVFVGHADGDYKIRLKEDNIKQDAYYFMGNSGAILSARISYLLNLKGPSLSLDTACSSSLVALHLACESMRSGESEMAVVGGVSVFLTPQLYLLAGNAGMLSADGQCKTFDNSADGFVPAEGIGAVILKPISKALKDKDRIYAVIKGSGINQDGRSNGITAPCAVSQTLLEQEVYDKYEIDPENISYIEAHGTGTKLGDPIEVTALTDAFNKYTGKENYCALGSVKANIGHTQLAAGVASVIKAVLMLQNKKLPPLVNFKELNTHIDLKRTPFYINTELKEWEVREGKRQAAISSFGFSGTNAHVVLEECDHTTERYEESSRRFYPICISAKSKTALINGLKELNDWINKNRQKLTAERISYSLLKYKSHYNIRMAFIVSDIEELIDRLKEFTENTGLIEITDVKAEYKANGREYEAVQKKIKKAIGELISENYDKEKENSGYLAEAYKAGFLFKADELYKGKEYIRMSMPKYRYDLEKFWYHPANKGHSRDVKAIDTMITQSISANGRKEYETVLKKESFYIKDHDVNGAKIFPGAACIELARQAGKAAYDKIAEVYEHIIWQKPIKVEDDEYTVYTQLVPLKDSFKFSIYSQNELHCQGSVRFNSGGINKDMRINIDEIKKKLPEELDRNEHYEYFVLRGMHHGESLKGVQKLYSGKNEALAYIKLPENIKDTKNDFELHPALLDSALQSVIGIKEAVSNDNNVTFLPFSIKRLTVYRGFEDSIYAYARQTGTHEFTVRITSTNGNIIADVESLVMRKMSAKSAEIKEQYTYLEPVWQIQDMPAVNQIVDTAVIVNAIEGTTRIWSAAKLESDKRSAGARTENTYFYEFPVRGADGEEDTKNYIYIVEKAGSKINLMQKGVYNFFQFVKNIMLPGKTKGLNILYAYERNQTGAEVLDAVSSFCKAVLLENPSVRLSSVGYDRTLSEKQLIMELNRSQNEFIRYENEKRYGEVFVKAKGMEPDVTSYANDDRVSALPPDSTYLITGGNGKIGNQIADYLINKKNSKVIIIGRDNTLNSDIFNKSGNIFYYKADLCDADRLEKTIGYIKNEHGFIECVFHCAGIHKDSFIRNKTIEEFKEVTAPKVTGTDNLIRCLNSNFKYFVFFSSTTSICGTPGQSDYAYANGYLNEYARNHRGSKNRYISICWPYWENGGMHISDEDKAFMRDTMGLEPITVSEGIKALETIILSGKNNVVFIKGDEKKFGEYLNKTNVVQKQISCGTTVLRAIEGDVELNKQLYQNVKKEVYDQITDLIKVSRDKLEDGHDFTDYGFDSILLTSLTNNINGHLGTDFMPTVFFDASKMGEFIQYLCETYHDLLTEKFGLAVKENTTGGITEDSGRKTGNKAEYEYDKKIGGESSFESARLSDTFEKEAAVLTEDYKEIFEDDGIAVIGMSGKMPQCDDLEEFFRKLEAETDFITEIPKERWDWKEFGKEDMRWGAFMKEINQFDAFFFSISPREAELMDPQQRILLECVWHTIEDAGYKASDLQGSNTGVFIGVSTMDYTDLAKRMNVPVSGYTSTGRAHSILANRISYVYDFRGPSEPVDTACSSSLIAIIHGVNAIKNGDCDMVIAGGVNVIASDDLYVAFSKSGMLASDGRCKTFDKNADGYARGEGVGTVLLKSLSKAKAEGDRIYAVIRGGAVNHGGHANSLTAPRAGAQTSLIVKAYENAGITPLDISYIEAHGTGTKLGDPIEVEGLNKAFKQMYKDYGITGHKEGYCNIGSVKSNVGHLEAAAGIAGVFKVILSMGKRKIPASINIKELNPYLKMNNSPFHIVRKTMDWVCGPGRKRIAGVSCYGYGGANAHLILEEYIQQTHSGGKEDKKSNIFIYSAKNKERLSEYIKKHIEFLENKREDDTFSLSSYAYTLQTCREEMEERFAVETENAEFLAEALKGYINGEVISHCYTDSIESGKELVKTLSASATWNNYIKTVVEKEDYKTLAALWVKGIKVDWKSFYREGRFEKISIPLYPFKKDRYWLPEGNTASSLKPVLHPLIDENVSTIDMVLFKKFLSQKDFFIKDHNIQGITILPGVAYLEMARAAGELAAGKTIVAISDVIWAQAIEVEKTGRDSFIGFTKVNNSLSYNIYYTSLGKNITASQGKILMSDQLETGNGKVYDINYIEKRCGNAIGKEDAYSLFKTLGFLYGESFKSIQRIKSGKTEAIGMYKLPDIDEVKNPAYKLIIPVMDAALQTIMGTGSEDEDGETRQFIPFALKRLIIYDRIPEEGYTYIRLNSRNEDGSVRKFDISILDEKGKEAVLFEGFTSRAVKGLSAGFHEKVQKDKIYYTEQWKISELDSSLRNKIENELFIVFGNETTVSLYKKELEKRNILNFIGVYRGYEYQNTGSNIRIRIDEFEDYERLFADLNLNIYSETTILHTFSTEESIFHGEPLEFLAAKERLARGFYSMSYAVKALLKRGAAGTVKIAYLYSRTEEAALPEYEMVNGMIKSVSYLSGKVMLTAIAVSSSLTDNVMLLNTVKEMMGSSVYESKQIWYRNGKRYEKGIEEVNINRENGLKEICEGDKVIITGGLGMIGKLFAEYLIKRNVNVVLMGRRDLDKDMKWLDELNKGKANIYYVKGDLSRYIEAEKMFEEARKHLGTIDGIIHAAGLAGKGTIVDGDWKEYKKPLKAKVYGTINIDNLIRKDPIRYIICFSSVASKIGDFGACCYACGNEFLNAYAQTRNVLADKHVCSGKTYSIDWGIWEKGGMSLPTDTSEQYYSMTGMIPLSNNDGIDMFQDIMGQNEKVIIAVMGDKLRVDKILIRDHRQEAIGKEQKQRYLAKENPPVNIAVKKTVKTIKKSVQEVNMLDKAAEYFRQVIADAVKIAPSLVEERTSFEKLGIDSFMVMEIHDVLDKNFKGLSRTLFFEYQNLRDLVNYFMSEYKDALEKMFRLEDSEKYEEIEEVIGEVIEKGEQIGESCDEPSYVVNLEEDDNRDIAIIGISGRYPMAENIDEFYENLKNGKDCIEEIPAERFDYRKFYDKKGGKGKITCKWGGFIADVDKFDEEFFGIIPKIASIMDPQERLMLETAWQAIEDSGYTPKELTESDTTSRANDVGVFIGMMYDDYKLIETQELVNHNYDSLTEYWNSPIANRISFIFDFRGPSIAVDSACSSSLTTLHMACESIKNGDCKYAVAGGVSLSLHPSKYLRLTDFGMSSPTGSCKSFGENADGYVPGEGVGAVLLKSFKQAKKDRDNIYAVIKGSSINHGGRANGFTVPNPNAQSDVIIHAMEAGSIDPRTISYIETHGTGTSLGDPIEIAGLTKAFKRSTNDKQFCKIGSVKSNIGHCEGAAGISQVTKVALQLKNKLIFPSIHADTENPLIDFNNSPFVVQKKLENWDQPEIKMDNEIIRVPRRAGISSFGAGGSNAHVIMEEYIPQQPVVSFEHSEELIFISANEEDSLKELLKLWVDFLERTDAKIHDISYTSIVGRISRVYRFAMAAKSKEDAKGKIHRYLTTGQTSGSVFYGIVEKEKTNADFKGRFDKSIIDGNLNEIAALWTQGAGLDYSRLFDNKYNFRVSLPNHPLRKNRHWIKITYDSNNIADEPKSAVFYNREDEKKNPEPHQAKPEAAEIINVLETTDTLEKVYEYLVGILFDITGIKKEKINIRKDFSEFGIDSIGITNFGNRILEDFPAISETALYAYQTVEDLAKYMCDTFEDEIADFFDLGGQGSPLTEISKTKEPEEEKKANDIAIVGISAKIPGSETMDEFWNYLCKYKESGKEINRWDLEAYYDTEAGKPGKTYCKNGNFLESIDKFDAGFFHIAKSEANAIDPQERMFLETVWNAMEDAGYTKDTLDRNTGVYVGVTTSSYRYVGYEESMKGNPSHSTTSFASIANRVSYVLNLIGPSMPVDTMCSSVLAAIHMACKSINSGECKMAIAGGVNLYSHPMALVNLSQVKLLSQDNKTRSFCENGTGFLPAEAVGAVILKSLDKAKKDGDYVYGVIKGSAASHIGKTTAYFSSNPLKQAEIIEDAVKNADVPKESISYIETMTVGSETGDSLEIEALKKVFNSVPDGGNLVSIGSVKPNIGHAEAASGIGQLLKVLLQFKYKRLAPTLLNGKVSNKIKLEGSRLRIQTEEEEWRQIKHTQKSGTGCYPRRAGISSFGAGGYGVHMIFEEAQNDPADMEYHDESKESVFPISSNTKRGVLRNVKKLLEYCKNKNREGSFYDIKVNLQNNREQYPYRIAVIADSMEELISNLEMIEKSNFTSVNLYTNIFEKPFNGNLTNGGRQKLIMSWIKGDNVKWNIPDNFKCRKVPLPGYSFEPTHCWIDKEENIQESLTAIQQGNYTLMPFWNGVVYKYLYEKGMKRTNEIKRLCSGDMYPFFTNLLKLLAKNRFISFTEEGYLPSETEDENFRSVIENPARRSEYLIRVFPELTSHLFVFNTISGCMEDILKENTSLPELFQEEDLYAIIKNDNRFDNLLLNGANRQIKEKLNDFIGTLKILDNNTFTLNAGRLLIEICRDQNLKVVYYLVEEIPCIRKVKERILDELGINSINIAKEDVETIAGVHVVINGRKNSPQHLYDSDTIYINSLPAIKDYYIILYQLMKDQFGIETIINTPEKNFIEISGKEDISKKSNTVADYVLDIITKELGVSKSNIELEVELSEYGMNSILMARLYTKLADKYGEKIEPKDILQIKCTKDIILNIENKLRGVSELKETQELRIFVPAASECIFTARSGNKYEYSVDGEGEPLLILTALAFTPGIWAYQKEKLRDKYKIIMPALPAHGNSIYEGQKLSFDIIVEDMKEFLEYLNIDSAYMIGWCLAGNILQKFMLKYPEFVRKACLVCTTPEDASIKGVNAQDLQSYSKDPLGTYELEFMNIYKGDKSKSKDIQRHMKLIQSSHCQINSIALMYYIDELFKFNIQSGSVSIHIPTLIIAGKWDITYPAEQVKLLTNVFKNTRLEIFEYSGHMPFVSEHNKFNKQVCEFLC